MRGCCICSLETRGNDGGIVAGRLIWAGVEPLESIYTHSVPRLLAELGCSVLVTTYQAGRLVILRNDPKTGGTQLALSRVWETADGAGD